MQFASVLFVRPRQRIFRALNAIAHVPNLDHRVGDVACSNMLKHGPEELSLARR